MKLSSESFIASDVDESNGMPNILLHDIALEDRPWPRNIYGNNVLLPGIPSVGRNSFLSSLSFRVFLPWIPSSPCAWTPFFLSSYCFPLPLSLNPLLFFHLPGLPPLEPPPWNGHKSWGGIHHQSGYILNSDSFGARIIRWKVNYDPKLVLLNKTQTSFLCVCIWALNPSMPDPRE